MAALCISAASMAPCTTPSSRTGTTSLRPWRPVRRRRRSGFIATLGPGQSLMISVPQAVGEPSLDFEVVRIGEALFVGDPVSVRTVDLAHE